MGVTDVGVAGQPATNLTAWQRAVRDALNSSDVPVDTRITNAVPTAAQSPYIVWCYAGTSDASGVLNVTWPASLLGKRPFVQVTAITGAAIVSTQVTALTTAGATVNSYRINPQAGYGCELHITAMVPR